MTNRTHRVGSITLGCSLVAFGVLFLAHLLFEGLSYELIFHLWPLILIGLGVELLICNASNKRDMVYDKGTVVILMIMSFFAMCMAGADMLISTNLIQYL